MRVALGLFLLTAFAEPPAALGQEEPTPSSRAEAIQARRREKTARLWPEAKSPIAEIANGFVERGLLDGVSEGFGGGNGWQIALGGMRSGQGLSLGAGYRRSDLFRDRLGLRTTVRGTPRAAWMADLQIYLPPLMSKRGFLDTYIRYEYSPRMDYYGEGPNTSIEDRTSYRLEDFLPWVRGGWEFHRLLCRRNGRLLLGEHGLGQTRRGSFDRRGVRS